MKKNHITTLSGIAAALALTSCDPLELDKGKADSAAATPPAAAPAAPAAAPAAPAAAPAKPAPAPVVVAAPAAPAAPATPAPAAAPSGEMEVIKPNFPKPMFIGTPVPAGDIPNLETGSKPVLEFSAPKGTVNLAQGKPVTSSDPAPIIGDLTLVTDGDADGADGNFVELAPGHQWVQIDLGAPCTISKILAWHYHKNSVVYFDVNVQVSDDPEFKTGVTTLYNTDHDNSSGLGAGADKVWVQTNHGRLFDAKGTKGRYVRLYSNGNTASELNHYCEVAVYGTK
jgi:F5/8 type C domain